MIDGAACIVNYRLMIYNIFSIILVRDSISPCSECNSEGDFSLVLDVLYRAIAEV